VAGHRLGTKEIEEAIGHHPEVAESAVVGIHDELKGELPIAFCILKNHDLVAETENRFRIEQQIVGEVASPTNKTNLPQKVVLPCD
jgi:propionyl-CoA synthetase